MDKQEEMVRLLALQFRAMVPNQAEAIRQLSKLKFGTKRIAELLGTTANTVNVTLQQARKAPSKAAKDTRKNG